MELIDIYNAELHPLGTKDRVAAHRDGDWHITFHLWIVSAKGKGYVLYQWRSHDMQNFPDMLDVSAAGHLVAGEALKEGIREAEEELGIPLNKMKVHKLGYRVEVADQSNGQKNREYQGVHMACIDIDLFGFSPQEEEVSGLYWVEIQEGIELFSGNRERVRCEGIFYNRKMGVWEKSIREFSKDKFLPRIQNYYLTVHIMAERLLEGKLPLAIS